MKEAHEMWFTNKKLLDTVNLCMDTIREAGLTASEAESVPACLAQVIEASNQISMQNSVFAPTKLEVKSVNGGFDITPREFATLFFR